MRPIFLAGFDTRRQPVFRRRNGATIAFLAISTRGVISEIEIKDVAIVAALLQIEISAAAIAFAAAGGIQKWNEEQMPILRREIEQLVNLQAMGFAIEAELEIAISQRFSFTAIAGDDVESLALVVALDHAFKSIFQIGRKVRQAVKIFLGFVKQRRVFAAQKSLVLFTALLLDSANPVIGLRFGAIDRAQEQTNQ